MLSYLGNGLLKLVENTLPKHASSDFIQEVYRSFMIFYVQQNSRLSKPYNGLEDYLDYLHASKIQLAVLTNKDHQIANEITHRHYPKLFKYCLSGIPKLITILHVMLVSILLQSLGDVEAMRSLFC